MMNRAIVYTTRNPGGREGANLFLHFPMLTTLGTVDMLAPSKEQTPDKSHKQTFPIKIVRSVSGLEIREVRNLYEKDLPVYRELEDWMAVYNALDVSELSQYDNLVIIGGIELNSSKLTRYGERVGVFPHDKGQMKFGSHACHLINILALLKAHREYNIPLHEVAFDPNEMSVDLMHEDVAVKDNYYLYHGYDIPGYNMKRIDTLQYCLSGKKNVLADMMSGDKTLDLFFGYTIMKTSARQKFDKWIDSITEQFDNKLILVKNDITGIDTTVKKQVYLMHLKESKYTMILPAYDENCFSVYRLIEALDADCLPILHPDCNVSDINKSFGIDLSYLQIEKPFTDQARKVLLATLKNKVLRTSKYFR